MKDFNHTVQLCGFTSERISEYVHKISHTTEEEEYIMKYLNANPNIAGLCQVPLHCVFVCALVIDMHACAESAEAPTVNTTTGLYVQATVQTASKLHPRLKYSKKVTDLGNLFDTIEGPLIKHADLARHGILSSPPKFVFYKDDLNKFDFDSTDINCGFLEEAQTQDARFKGATQSCWTFTHTTMQEFFAALALLRSDNSVWEHFEKSPFVEKLKTTTMFLGGLLGDTSHRYYVERLLSRGAKLDSQQLTKKLAQLLVVTTLLTKLLNDDTMIIATVFETQNSDMVKVVPTEIRSSNMTVMDMLALVWLLKNEDYHITSLR